MEVEFEKLAQKLEQGNDDVVVGKLRGDTRRDFVKGQLGAQSFPTIFCTSKGTNQLHKYPFEERTAEKLEEFFRSVSSA